MKKMRLLLPLLLAVLSDAKEVGGGPQLKPTQARPSEGCPKGQTIVNCFMDPCQNATCPIAEQLDVYIPCVSNYCGGCNAEWSYEGKDVTDLCNADMSHCDSTTQRGGTPIASGCLCMQGTRGAAPCEDGNECEIFYYSGNTHVDVPDRGICKPAKEEVDSCANLECGDSCKGTDSGGRAGMGNCRPKVEEHRNASGTAIQGSSGLYCGVPAPNERWAAPDCSAKTEWCAGSPEQTCQTKMACEAPKCGEDECAVRTDAQCCEYECSPDFHDWEQGCDLANGDFVPGNWSGMNNGQQWCNGCKCSPGEGLFCQHGDDGIGPNPTYDCGPNCGSVMDGPDPWKVCERQDGCMWDGENNYCAQEPECAEGEYWKKCYGSNCKERDCTKDDGAEPGPACLRDCRTGCACKDDYVRDVEGVCVPFTKSVCRATTPPTPAPACGEGEYWRRCYGSNCKERDCSWNDGATPGPMCNKDCRNGCACEGDYVRTSDGTCAPFEEGVCSAGGGDSECTDSKYNGAKKVSKTCKKLRKKIKKTKKKLKKGKKNLKKGKEVDIDKLERAITKAQDATDACDRFVKNCQ